MSKQGLMHAAVTAASIANFLVVDAGKTRAQQLWNTLNDQQSLHVTGKVQQISYGTGHTTLQVKAGDQVWTVILALPLPLQQAGLLEDVLNVEQHIRLIGPPLHDGSNEVWAA